MNYIPYVIENTGRNERSFDIFSRLLNERIVILGSAIDDTVSNIIIAQLLHLEDEAPEKDINLYINSPGGHISAGMAIYDTMQFIKPDVRTICVGMAASMGAVLLSAGAPGKRFMLPNSEVMIHQPLGGFEGQATDIEIQAKHILKTKAKLNKILAHHTGTPLKTIEKNVERDHWLDADEALAYGIIDQIISKRP